MVCSQSISPNQCPCLQATVAQAGIDKLPPPITPENNPHTVPGQFDLNGNDQRGHIIAAGAELPAVSFSN